MSQITIQCRLIASEPTRQHLWHLATNQNTPLINELIQQLAQHADFETWRQKGKLPSTIVSNLCKPLKTDARFSGQSGRLYASAEHTADYIFRSTAPFSSLVLYAKIFVTLRSN